MRSSSFHVLVCGSSWPREALVCRLRGGFLAEPGFVDGPQAPTVVAVCCCGLLVVEDGGRRVIRPCERSVGLCSLRCGVRGSSHSGAPAPGEVGETHVGWDEEEDRTGPPEKTCCMEPSVEVPPESNRVPFPTVPVEDEGA